MGQGVYQAIMFGVLDPDIYETDAHGYLERAAWIERAIDGTDEARIRTAYECEPDYLGIVLAVSDGCLADMWHAAEISDRQAVLLESVAESLGAGLAERLEKARRIWAQLQETAKAAGKTLPDGQLLYVSDYD
jgi:hypothetical protein